MDKLFNELRKDYEKEFENLIFEEKNGDIQLTEIGCLVIIEIIHDILKKISEIKFKEKK